MLSLPKILILAAVQGAAELLPVSSSAHVIVAEKLMGLDPTAPEMTLLLVMLHTGTMFAVIWYFRSAWRESFFSSRAAFARAALLVTLATGATGAIGLFLKHLIEHYFLRAHPGAQIEMIFGNLGLMAAALAVVGLLIMVAGVRSGRGGDEKPLGPRESTLIGVIQGLCLPFRGFSRSGATISTGLLMGVGKGASEAFSFALAVVLTPPVIARELLRLLKADHIAPLATGDLLPLLYPSLAGMVLSFLSGLLALKWLSSWLEKGKWQLFGIYCCAASIAVYLLHLNGW